MATQRSPLAPKRFPVLPPVAGVRLAARACGIHYTDRTDACLIELTAGTTIAGVFTRSLTASAPVLWCRKALRGGRARAIIVNSGNANAFTGAAGRDSVERIVGAVTRKLKCKPREVFVASTGVIGEPLLDRQLTKALAGLRADLTANNWPAAAAAIMTTDTYPKGATRQAEIDGVPVTLNGIAKGSGMIAPDMATMLSFVATDAKIPGKTLQALLTPAADASFRESTESTELTIVPVGGIRKLAGGSSHDPSPFVSSPANRSIASARSCSVVSRVIDRLILKLLIQPLTRHLPAAPDRTHRNVQRLGRLLFRQVAEESKIDNSSKLRIDRFQPRERRVERFQIARMFLIRRDRLIKRLSLRAPPAALDGVASPRVIDQHRPHRFGRHVQALCAIH